MGTRRAGLVAALLLVAWSAVGADVVITVDGVSFEGTVVSNDALGVVVETANGTLTLPKEVVRSIGTASAGPATAPALRPGQRIPGWLAVVTELSGRPWAVEVRQIPATVIDKGVMRNVPYRSYRCGRGGDYELNIYGDPEDPAAIELGVYRDLLRDAEAKRRCVEFVASVLVRQTDAGLVRAADPAKDLITRDGLTVEVTPETAEDAYGGWWISVYSESALDQARASREEMKAITMTAGGKVDTPATNVRAAAPSPAAPSPSAAPAHVVAPTASASSASDPVAATSLDTWTAAEMAYARPSGSSSSSSSYGGSGLKTVYVRGYVRKNGTYVHSYTRSAPGYGHGSRGGHGGGHR